MSFFYPPSLYVIVPISNYFSVFSRIFKDKRLLPVCPSSSLPSSSSSSCCNKYVCKNGVKGSKLAHGSFALLSPSCLSLFSFRQKLPITGYQLSSVATTEGVVNIRVLLVELKPYAIAGSENPSTLSCPLTPFSPCVCVCDVSISRGLTHSLMSKPMSQCV